MVSNSSSNPNKSHKYCLSCDKRNIPSINPMADSRNPGDDDGGCEDRISNLPDDILHRILYYAGMRLAMRASVLSSRWRDVWRFMPRLNFDVEEFSGCPSPNKSLYDYALLVRYFRHTEVRVQKVRLVRLHEPNPIMIIFGEDNLWVGDESFRIGVGLEELELCNVEHGDDAADCLQTLRLLFRPWKNPYPNHYLAALRTFELWNCPNYKDMVFWLRENVWPVEEALFAHCNYRRIVISTGRLKILKLWHCGVSDGGFRVCAPNLVSLDCRRIRSSSLCLDSSPYVKEAFLDLMTDEGGAGSVIQILGAICNVKTLTLSSSMVKGLSVQQDLPESFPIFHNLKHVVVMFEKSSPPIKITKDLLQHWPNLVTLEIKH